VSNNKKRETFCAEIATILRETRLKRELSMTQVSERAGLSQQMVSYVERGVRIPGLDTLLRITEALEINVSEVVQLAQERANLSVVPAAKLSGKK
jgi:transcriptional regulator with XRE-family HTH domain